MNKQELGQSITESYILRIYRRNTEEPQELVGTIEDSIDGRKQSFSTPQSLMEWLLHSDSRKMEDE